MKCNKETMVRSLVLMLSLLNQILTVYGKNPLPFSEGELYRGLSTVATVAATLWGWWKNNSFTPEARKADEYLKALKSGVDAK